MKKLIILSGFIFFSLILFAQGHRDKEGFEEFRTKKITYITDKLKLSPEEAQHFWPYYNEFDDKRFDLHRKKRDLEKTVWDNYDTYSEKEFKKINDEIMDLHETEFNLTKEYRKKFLEVLPAKKVVVLEHIENEFRFQMIREFRKREKQE